jgi:hypothetical protein
MPMLHSCAARGCKTRTLSTYCVDHELLRRLELQLEREGAVAAAQAPPLKMGGVTDRRREEPAAT